MTRTLKIISTSLFWLASSIGVMAASTPWVDLGGGKARLVASKDPSTNQISGLIEVKLDTGWKTYWRSPGSSGIPPEFNFDGSDSLTLEKLDFPVPKWIEHPDYSFFGYKDRVSFPFTARGEAVGSNIKLDMLIGVCEEICIPATAQFSISDQELNTTDPKAEIEIEIASASLPATSAIDFTAGNLTENGDTHTVEITHTAAKGKLFFIPEIEGKWTSDPIIIDPSQGKSVASFTVPASVKTGKDVNWRFTLLQLADDNHTIQRAAEDSLKMANK